MEEVTSPVDYDGITSYDLFMSFMNVALDAELSNVNTHDKNFSENNIEIKDSTTTTNQAGVTADLNQPTKIVQQNQKTLNAQINGTEPPVVYPLLVRRSEPIYAVCDTSANSQIPKPNVSNVQQRNEYAVVDMSSKANNLKNQSNAESDTSNTVKQLANIDDKSNHLEQIVSEDNNESHHREQIVSRDNNFAPSTGNSKSIGENLYNEVIIQHSPSNSQSTIKDLYAIPDKSKKNNDSDQSIFYAVPDKSKKTNNENSVSAFNDENPIENYDHNGVTSKQVVKETLKSDYAEVPVYKPSLKPSASSEYEIISTYQKPVDAPPSNVKASTIPNVELSVTKSTDVFNAEQIAFAHQSKGHKEMFSTITNTIEKGNLQQNAQFSPRSSSTSNKKYFFNFGKKPKQIQERTFSEAGQNWAAQYNGIPSNPSPALKRQSSTAVICSGYMTKQGGTGLTPKNWRLRWFELKADNCLYYYKSEQDQIANGAVMLLKYSVARAVEVNKQFAFKLVKGGARTYYFAPVTEDDMKKWMKHLSEAAKHAVSDHTSIPECSLKNVSIPALSITEPDCHGFLYKQGDSHKSWRRRYCVLKYGCLFYYEDISNEVAIGVFKLHNYVIKENPSMYIYGFEAVPPLKKMRKYQFYVETEIEFKRWVEAMKYSIATFKS